MPACSDCTTERSVNLTPDFDAVVQPYRQVVEKLRTHSSGRIEAVAIDTVHRELDTQSGAARPVVNQ